MDKSESKSALLRAIARYPRFEIIRDLVEDMPTDAEMAAQSDVFVAALEAAMKSPECDILPPPDFDLDFIDTPVTTKSSSAHAAPKVAPAPCTDRSNRITIRIPGSVLAAIKAQARLKCVPYQTLINRTLRSAVAGWKV